MTNPNRLTEPFPEFAAEFTALIEKYRERFDNGKRVVNGFTLTWLDGKALDIDDIKFKAKK